MDLRILDLPDQCSGQFPAVSVVSTSLDRPCFAIAINFHKHKFKYKHRYKYKYISSYRFGIVIKLHIWRLQFFSIGIKLHTLFKGLLPGFLKERQKEGKEQNWRFNKKSGYFFVVTDTIWPSLDVFGYPQIGSDTSRFSSWIPPVSHQFNERGALPTSFSNNRTITSSNCSGSSNNSKQCISSSSSSDNLNERGALATRWQTVFHKSRPREGKLCGFASSSSICGSCSCREQKSRLGEGKLYCK